MKSIGIYYFSGTGNTELVINMFKEEFLKLEYNVDLIKIEDVLKNGLKIETEKYDFVGIGSQVIGFGAPNIVKEFIKRLPKGNGIKAFVFRTAGGVAPINYNASKPMIRKLAKKGYVVFHERVFSISSNWVAAFDDEVIKQLYIATGKKVAIMCKQIIAGHKRILTTGVSLKVGMELAMPIFSWSLRLVGKDLIINKSCSHCGLCVKKCPAENIYKKSGKIKFKFSCNSCMRCVYSCPQKAIGFRFLKFFPVPGGYNIKKILSQPSCTEESVNKTVPPFFNEYLLNEEL